MPDSIMDGLQPPSPPAPVPFTALPAPAPQPAAPPAMRDFGDHAQARKLIFDRSLAAARALKPVQNSRYSLAVENVDYEDKDDYPISRQKEAILRGDTLYRRLRGDWVLRDLAGQELERRRLTLAQIPWLTQQGAFIINGRKYGLGNQQRLRGGIYARVKENGELEAMANHLPGKGVTHRYSMEPDTGVFKVHFAQASLPLISVLKALGKTDSELREAWGNDLYAANARKDDPRVIDRLYQRLVRRGRPDATDTDKVNAVKQALEKMEFDAEVNKRNLGHPHANLNADAMLASAKKLLALSRGEAEPDDRDHPANQLLMGPEDLIAERLERPGSILHQLLWKVSTKGTLQKLPVNAFDRHVKSAILDSGVGQYLTEINPLEVLDQSMKITRMGVGGIQSIEAVPSEARSVQPAQIGYIDPIFSPESFRAGVDARVAYAAKKGADGRLYAPYTEPGTGKTIYKSPQDVADMVLAFPGELETDAPYVAALTKGRIRYVPRDKVDLILPHPEQWFGSTTNLVALKNASKGQRGSMGARFLSQALPLRGAEAPLVRSKVIGTENQSFEELYGRQAGAVFADQDGRVVDVTPDGIKVKYADGSVKTHDLYNNFPMNQKSVTGDMQIFIKRNGRVFSTCIADYAWLRGDLTVSIDPATKKSAWMRVLGAIKHRNDKRLLKVVMRSGRHVTVTEDHSLITIGSDGELTPIYPADCEVGVTKSPVAAVPSDNSEDGIDPLGVLAGLYLAEGYCGAAGRNENVVCLAVLPSARIAQARGLLRQLGYSPHDGRINAACNSASLRDYLASNFGKFAHGKRIPDWVVDAPAPFRRGLVVGYMSGDGCLSKDSKGGIQVSAVSVSKRLCEGMAAVLSSLGVFTTFFDAPRKKYRDTWRDGFGFRVTSQHLDRLPRWFFYDDREEILRGLLKPVESFRASPYDTVPVLDRKARRLVLAGFKEAHQHSNCPKAIRRMSEYNLVAKKWLRQCDGVFGLWGSSDVMWDTIESITEAPHEEFVYDLSVETSQVFAVNGGLIVHNTSIHSTPVVKPGDPITPGQLLARSNFTDDKGHVALGLNARVAFMPFRGRNHLDAWVISKSFADRLASEHLYQNSLDFDDKTRVSKKHFTAMFAAKFDKKALEAIDDNGIVKPGTVVKPGDPLVLAVTEKPATHKSVHSGHKGSFADQSLLWEHHDEGVVTDVMKTPRGVVVAVKSVQTMKPADKLAGRYGNKGVVGSIVDDDEMPRDAQGRPFDVLANPTGVITRTNASQKAELWLGKIAAATGKPYVVEDFSHPDLMDFVDKELQKHGLSAMEDVFDPTTGRMVKVATGMQHVMKLHHQAESKAHGRGIGGYTSENQPARGGTEGCFAAGQPVMTSDGIKKIGRICEKRLGVHALSFCWKTGKWMYKPVVDWFVRRARVDDMRTIHVADGTTMYVTNNHWLYTSTGHKVQAGAVQAGDMLASWGPLATVHQLSLMYGSLLGDASATSTAFTCEHSVKQTEYVCWKQSVLSGLGASISTRRTRKKKNRIRGVEVNSSSSKIVSVFARHLYEEMRRCCYSGIDNTKRITDEWLSRVDGLGVAVWVLDDGWIGNRAKKAGQVKPLGKIYTCGFCRGDVEKLATWLSTRYNAGCAADTNGAITLSMAMCWALIAEIAKWVPADAIPRSKKFLREHVRLLQKLVPPNAINSVCELGVVPQRVTRVDPYVPAKNVKEVNVYDITVQDTHTYCAGSTLVSNSKKIALMDVHSMLSAGATEVLRDARLIRGQKNAEYWTTAMAGFKPPTPDVPLVYKKFVEQLRAAGINVQRKGSQLHLFAMTDKDIDHLVENREIKNMETVDWKNGMKPIPGGLFDPTTTGGHAGNKWGFFKLLEPLPSPVFEDPIRHMLGLTGKQFEDVLVGRAKLDGKTGPKAIHDALAAIDVKKALAAAREDLHSARKGKRDEAVRRLGYLKALEKQGISPKDWMLSKVPVIPPLFRPVSQMLTGQSLVSDANFLYKEVWDANENLKELRDKIDDTSEERLTLYNALKAVVGLGDPVQPKNREKKIAGFLSSIFGSSPKYSAVQQKLLGTPVDLVGRSVVITNPDLTIDEAGIPEPRAWEVYSPFLVRRLVRQGVGRVQAVEAVDKRSPLARKALIEEMDARPVIINRAPVLHRYGRMAFFPRLVKGDALQLSPLVAKGFNLDSDGDVSNYEVPASDEAASEALHKMLPSRNLIAVSDFKKPVHVPQEDYIGGIHSATATVNKKKRPRVFATKKDALQAWWRGEMDPGDPIEIIEE